MFSQKSTSNESVSKTTPAAASGKSITVQRQLTVGAVNDPLEHEADAVAAKVMRMPEQNFVQRKCADCEKEEKLRRKPISETITPMIQAKGEGNATVSNGVAEAIQSSKGNGAALDSNTRSFMSTRFGTDFSNVKIHTDGEAIQMNRELNAKAFTTGNDIYFNEGQYQPGSASGKQLLGHELTHVVQQGHTGKSIQRMIMVDRGLELDTMGYSVIKSNNFYSCANIVKSSIHHELFTSLLNSERIFKLKGKSNAEVNRSLNNHMAARLGIIDFASKKKYTFGAGAAFKMSPDFWQPGGSLKVKPGVDRTKAIDDLNVHPEKYQIACLAATKLTMEGGSRAGSFIDDTSSTITDWLPGDWGYITNTIFSDKINSPGYEGENLIYNGKDMFWGHFGSGNTYKTLDEWMAEVNSWKNSKASLDTQRTYTKIGLE